MPHLDEKALNICTDGSSYSSPRVGGVGFMFIAVDDEGEQETHEECPPGWIGASNNQICRYAFTSTNVERTLKLTIGWGAIAAARTM
jgi:ribonuclease HI